MNKIGVLFFLEAGDELEKVLPWPCNTSNLFWKLKVSLIKFHTAMCHCSNNSSNAGCGGVVATIGHGNSSDAITVATPLALITCF